MSDSPDKIRITFDEVDSIVLEQSQPLPVPAAMGAAPSDGPRQWGSVASVGAPAALQGEQAGAGSFFLKGWVYLGFSGMLGAFIGWAICEPAFNDTGAVSWGNAMLFPLMLMLQCAGLAVAESMVERSFQKALKRGLLALGLGILFGFFFAALAGVIFMALLRTVAMRSHEIHATDPAVWFSRAFAWVVFGISGGVVYGIVGQSKKKCLYGILGGMVGAGFGGLLFDPISVMMGGAALSRMVGLSILGLCTGVSIGLVESALKDRWLYVSAGPLAGKQFILYKAVTHFGSQQSNDVYLFKDTSILPNHAAIQLRGPQTVLLAQGLVTVGGRPVTQHVLRSGDVIQIGRYSFNFQEKQASR